MKTVEFLDAIRARYNLPSDYATAEKIGCTRQMISRYRSRDGEAFGDETALKVAELLDLEPAYVLACVHAERAKNLEVKSVWSQIAARMEKASGVAAAVILSVLFSGSPDAGAQAKSLDSAVVPTHVSSVDQLYIVANKLAAILAFFGFGLRRLNLRASQQHPHFAALPHFA